jgi:hypothetical protein
MSFKKKLKDFIKKSDVEINSKALDKRVKSAMKLNGVQRDNAMKQIMLDLFPIEAQEHEAVRIKTDLIIARNQAQGFEWGMEKDMGIHDFTVGYIDLICERAKEIDPSYKPPAMMGLGREEYRTMLQNRVDSYTERDAIEFDLFELRTLKYAMIDNENARYSKSRKYVRNYHSEGEQSKAYIEEVYTRRELVKEKLARKSRFWKWRHPFKTGEMKRFIESANKTLKDVGFTDADAEPIRERNRKSATPLDDIPLIMKIADNVYNKLEKEQSEPQNNVVAQPEENIKEQITVNIPDPFANKDISKPVANEQSLEKGSIQINS